MAEQRLIDAKALREKLYEWCGNHCEEKYGCGHCNVSEIIDIIADAPTIEAKPVVHAHWETVMLPIVGATEDDYEEEAYKCSNCKRTVEVDTPYCAFCGAQMDEVTE